MVETGYEEILAHRASEPYATTAKKPGKVIGVTPKSGIVVKYDDGQEVGYFLGRYFGHAAGKVIPHDIDTRLSPGDKFEVGEPIAYSTAFFAPSFFSKKRINWKSSMLAETLLWETPVTFEDGSSLSQAFCNRAEAEMTHIKTVVVPATAAVHRLIAAGTAVDYHTPVCVLADSITSGGQFSEGTIDALSELAAQSPKAGYEGTVDDIIIYYNADPEDMSPELIKLVSASDKRLAAKANACKKPVYTGRVDEGYRIDGEPLSYGFAAIAVYITSKVAMGVADKGVIGSQLKTITSQTVDIPYTTEAGRPIDVTYSHTSVNNRVVTAPYLNGTCTAILQQLQDAMCKAYDE